MTSDAVTAALGHRPGKVIAVHLSYRSRAEQRGRTPSQPSYFLKTSSSVTGSGTVARPEGTELLGFEGEIALVIGKPALRVAPETAWEHVGWVTASNDLGLHDLRYADKGSNVRSKGGDGYTPLGPDLIPAEHLRPDRIGIRTWLDGALVQNDTSAGLLFPFALLIADLSRVMTLEPGDVILTGTPAGSSVAQPGARIDVEVFSLDDPTTTSGKLSTTVTEGPPLPGWGHPPTVDESQRADAWGTPVASARPVLTEAIRERLHGVAVATLSVQLRKRGFDHVSIEGVRPLVPGSTIVGTARTLRYVPYRKDLFAEHGGGFNAQKQAIESVGAGEVLVMEARQDPSAGTLGDILALRAKVRGAAGIVTDGAVRDAGPVGELGLPVYCAGTHPAVLGRRHVPWETDTTISCGGATVCPGDIIVADDDGAIVIPPSLVAEVLTAAEIQEQEETFIAERVADGESVEGLYPMGPRWKAAFEQWRAERR
ncbi:Regulator of RNase E activity RraA [Prauserella marina]|uniref:Regulator of RNase E activity RraA n=1 Tax=Prauserella marina TaxID=530584 RepID=A0A1G6LNQ7_9PSEU|nr:fumarylacetoacetate hydrolase family protein [Prauserella marina]PWV85815.1 regulator of RNase E activity RraA [Prauserella marina]SDC44821.1 Regulator of RNase E activity RraA [Prauserella marina]